MPRETYLDKMEENKKFLKMQKCRECFRVLPLYCYKKEKEIISQVCEDCEKIEKDDGNTKG